MASSAFNPLERHNFCFKSCLKENGKIISLIIEYINHHYLSTGAKGRTDYLKLDKWFHNDFEAGSKEQYQVEAFDVGDIQLIELHSDGGGYWSGDPDWFVNKVRSRCTIYLFKAAKNSPNSACSVCLKINCWKAELYRTAEKFKPAVLEEYFTILTNVITTYSKILQAARRVKQNASVFSFT